MTPLKQTNGTSFNVRLVDLLTIEEAEIPGGAFALREINEQHVQDLTQSDHLAWPPIHVTPGQKGFILLDGNHRRKAAEAKGLFELPALSKTYDTANEIIEAVFRANLGHGLKASSGTRGDYAYWLFLSFPGIDQKDIALRAMMSQGAVSKAIAKREEDARNAGLDELGATEQYQAEQLCKQLVKRLVSFSDETVSMNEQEICRAIHSTLKPGQAAKLARVGQLLLSLQKR